MTQPDKEAKAFSPKRRDTLRGLAGIGASLASGALIAASPTTLPALRRGINLTHWFEYEQSKVVTVAEMLMLYQSGFDHVRIPVDPVVGGWLAAGLQNGFLAALRKAVEQALGSGLDVVLDLHLEPATKQQVEDQPALENTLLALWSTLARQFGDLPVARLAFEAFNEPQYYGWRAGRWPALQQRILRTIREHARHHLVLLSGNEGGSFKGLSHLPTSPDPSLAYTFHYYAPFLFTHQGAEWLDTRYTTAGLYRGVRYPAQFQAASPARLSRAHPKAEKELTEYLNEDWGMQRIRQDIDAVGRYAMSRGIRVLCNEFGVIRANVDAASRYRWINDVRSALEANGIGWALWDYKDIFGIAAESSPLINTEIRTLEPGATRALGLNGSIKAQ